MEAIILIILTFSIVSLLSIYDGFVLTKLWMWFVVPTFGLPMLTLPIAIGLALLVSFLTHQRPAENPNKSTSEQIVDQIAHGLSSTTIIFLMAWIVHLFV
jgi:hypothetical protein